jgi:hypothetical protein
MKIYREIANKHKEEKFQVYETDHNQKAINHQYKEGNLVLLRFFNVKGKLENWQKDRTITSKL